MESAPATLHVLGIAHATDASRVPLRSLPWTWERLFPLFLFQLGALLWFGAMWTVGCALSSSAEHAAEPWFDFERTAPFMPWLVPVYLSQNIAVGLAFIAFRNVRDYLPCLIVGLMLSLIAAACFALFPMRLGFEGGSKVWAPLGAFLGTPDPGAGGYAPSLHVAFMVLIAAVASRRWGPSAAPWLWLWAVAVSASTYFVHEHHIIDISTGALLGAFGVWLLPRITMWTTRLPHSLGRAQPVALIASVALLLTACAPPHQPTAPDELTRSSLGGPSAARRDSTPPTPVRDVDEAVAVASFVECWTLVKENHFDPTINGVDWDAVYAEFEPRAHEVVTRKELRHLLNEMLQRLSQSHFGVMPPPDESAPKSDASASESADGHGSDEPGAGSQLADGISGLRIRLVDGAAIVTGITPATPADRTDIAVGWELSEVNGRPLPLHTEPDVPDHLQTLAKERIIEHSISTNPGESTRLTFLDATGTKREIDLTFDRDRSHKVQLGVLPPLTVELNHHLLSVDEWEHTAARRAPEATLPRVGYITFTAWFPAIAKQFDEAVDALRDCDAIVIDLRGNPGGVGIMAAGFAGHFFSEPTSLGDMLSRSGTIHFKAQPRTVAPGGREVAPFAGPLAILLDSQTGSTSEVFAGGMVDVGRAQTFGGPSAGAALPAALTTLPSGDVFLYAIADYRVPSGSSIEGVGVAPSLQPAPSVADYRSSPDPTLRQALEWIASGAPASRPAPASQSSTTP